MSSHVSRCSLRYPATDRASRSRICRAASARDGYIDYLKATLQQQSTNHEQRVQQLHAHYNMLLNQDRRTIRILGTILTLLVAAFIFWLIVDVTHPTVGWIQRNAAYHSSGLASVADWLESNVWSA